MNSNDCKVLKYIIRYREVGNSNWITKSSELHNSNKETILKIANYLNVKLGKYFYSL